MSIENIASTYVKTLDEKYQTGKSGEHSYRAAIQSMFQAFANELTIINEPRQEDFGAPDFVLQKDNVPIGYVETKDIHVNLDSIQNTDQFVRYTKAISNIIFTNYLTFRLFVDGHLKYEVCIAKIKDKGIVGITSEYQNLFNLIKNFISFDGTTIENVDRLASLMADKARIMSSVLEAVLKEDENDKTNESDLKSQLNDFRKILIHDISIKDFSDMYSQTIAYGMFTAWFNQGGAEKFSRRSVCDRLPKSNPFLKKLFGFIGAVDLDERIRWAVDSLADIFRASDLKKILTDFANPTSGKDPIIHFYENFLTYYNPKEKKSHGVWYTPDAIVNFMVRSVCDILKTDFNILDGISDKVRVETANGEYHRVQILDPACGTGTFLAQIIRHIHADFKQKGVWNNYVVEHLIPRLHGFEILMAPYAIAHLAVETTLKNTNFDSKYQKRNRIFLTDSLHTDGKERKSGYFGQWLVDEANGAQEIKNEIPVMVICGNPPYKGESRNKNVWINGLMDIYKREPASKSKLKERNPKWINDDYVKFIRLAQHYVAKNGEGIVAFITAHGYLDNPTFRGMRYSLLETFDKIYIVDLHGNSRKKETSPDGSKDENVFNVMQGVSINIFIKTKALVPKRDFESDSPSPLGRGLGGGASLWTTADKYLYSITKKIQNELKLNPTESEKKMWQELRNNKIGYAIRRQHIINTFIVDFICLESKTVIEIDGHIHEYQKEYDEARTQFLNQAGFQVLRFTNDEVIENPNMVAQKIKKYIETSVYDREAPPPNPLPVGEGEFKKPLAEVFHFELYGKRLSKFQTLYNSNIENINWEKLELTHPMYYFVPKNFDVKTIYDKGFSLVELFPLGSVGIVTAKDDILIHFDKKQLIKNIQQFYNTEVNLKLIKPISYRPFDNRFVFYSNKVVERPREKVMKHFLNGDNIALIINREQKQGSMLSIFITTKMIDAHIVDNISYVYPLYKIQDENREPNLNLEILKEIELALGLEFVAEDSISTLGSTRMDNSESGVFSPINLLDYIYAVLHSQNYREKYKEFLKIDFPRVPYPKEQKQFWALVAFGGKLRRLHLLEEHFDDNEVLFEVSGDCNVEKIKYENGCVYINKIQYFKNVSSVAWNFYIGGYQPAQKWLKDRVGLVLSSDDVMHYVNIINTLVETDRVMKLIDNEFILE